MENKRKVLIVNGDEWDKQDFEKKIKMLKNEITEGQKFTEEEKGVLLNAIQRIENKESENCNLINNKEATDKLIWEIAHNKVYIIISNDAKTFNKIGKNHNLPGLIAAECSVYSLDGKINTISKENKFNTKVAVYSREFYNKSIEKNNKNYEKTPCEICKKDILTSDGCSIDTINVEGKTYKRIKVGDKDDFNQGIEDTEFRCHDCNAKNGHYHHWGCDVERCPSCKQQLISCECKDVYIEEFDSEASSLKYEKNRNEIERIKMQIAELEEKNLKENEQMEKIEDFLTTEKNRTKKR